MPDIGLVELIVIGLIAFLVVGPQRLPELMVQIADVFGMVRGWTEQLRTIVQQQAQAIKEPLEQERQRIRQDVENATTPISSEFQSLIDEADIRNTGEPGQNEASPSTSEKPTRE